MRFIKKFNALLILTVFLFSFSVLSFLQLRATSVTAESASAAVTVAAACTMTADVEEAHTDSIPPHTYRADIGTTTFNVLCNDSAGFSIYAVGYSGDQFGGNKLIATIGGELAPTYDIVTGTATSGDTSNWAMKLTKVAGTYAPTITGETQGDTEIFTAYHAIPSTYVKVATLTSATDATNGSSLEATYAAYVSGTQPAGTYDGKVKYTLVHPNNETPLQPQTSQSGEICYYKNANDALGTMDVCQDVAASVTLFPSNFSREGYGFAGWSDKFDWVINENDGNGNGTGTNAGYHIYGPNATISLTTADYSSPNNGLSLYAVWVPAEIGATMQTFNSNSSPYSTMSNGSVIALTDIRDDDTYAVAKLADGKWWMIENLRLDTTASRNESKSQGWAGEFAGLADPESPWDTSSSNTTANSLYSTDGSTTATISGSNLAYRFPRYNNQNTSSRIQSNYANTGNVYSYGNYYTWPAAVADTEDHTQNNQSYDSTSICPSGWHVPRGGDKSNEANNELWGLIADGIIGTNPANYDSQTYPYYVLKPEGNNASNAIRSYPNNFLYSGVVSSGSVSNRSSYGYYWSSTVFSSRYSYHLLLNSGYVYPGANYYNKNFGITVRCLAGS